MANTSAALTLRDGPGAVHEEEHAGGRSVVVLGARPRKEALHGRLNLEWRGLLPWQRLDLGSAQQGGEGGSTSHVMAINDLVGAACGC